VEALAGGVRTDYAQPDDDSQYNGRYDADQDQAAAHWRAAGTLSRLDARSQGRRRLDLGRSALRKRDRAPLLGKPVGKLRIRRDSRLERGTALRRERPVGERRQLGELAAVSFVLSTASHRHGNTKDTLETRASTWRRTGRGAGSRGMRRPPLKHDLAAATRTTSEPQQGRGGSTGTQQVLTLQRTRFGRRYSRGRPASRHATTASAT
jgi:hypothetical protein